MADFDAGLLAWFAAVRTPVLDGFFLALTDLGSLLVLLPVALLLASLLFSRRGWREALWLPIALIATTLLCQVLKQLTGRLRPALFEALIPLPLDGSWPSAHAAQSMAFAVACGLLFAHQRRAGAVWGLVLLAVLVGISRLYLQVHWPSDVAAGMLLGAGCALLAGRWVAAGRPGPAAVGRP